MKEDQVPVVYRPSRTNPPSGPGNKRTFSCNDANKTRIELKQGTNYMSPEKAEALANHPAYMNWHKGWKSIVIGSSSSEQEPSGDDKLPASLSALSVEEAQDAIQQTGGKDIEVLKDWLKREKRKSVIAALNARISELSKGMDA